MGERRGKLWRTAWRPWLEEHIPTMQRIGSRVWDDVGASAAENSAWLENRRRIKRAFRKARDYVSKEVDPHKT